MKKIPLLLALSFIVSVTNAQTKYFTKTGTVFFNAGASVEKIEGTNKSVTSIFDAGTGQMEFALLVKGFEFTSALMQEHFNENYMESDTYPKSIFKGKITNIDKVNFQTNGTYPVTVKGTLEIHGVKKEVEVKGEFKVNNGTVSSSSNFEILLSDYNVSIPGLVKDKISKTALIKVNCTYSILNK